MNALLGDVDSRHREEPHQRNDGEQGRLVHLSPAIVGRSYPCVLLQNHQRTPHDTRDTGAHREGDGLRNE